MNGAPKPVASGKKGNVGGISTPGRKGHMLHGLNMLVKSGPATKKTAVVSNMPRPEGAVHIDAGNVKRASGTSKPAAGSPKNISGGSGHKGVFVGVRPEGAIKRDAAKVVKP